MSTFSPGASILLILAALSQEAAVVFVLFAVMEGRPTFYCAGNISPVQWRPAEAGKNASNPLLGHASV